MAENNKIKASDLERSALIDKLRAMKIEYATESIYDNPVLLDDFYKRFSALTAILESQYASLRSQKSTKDVEFKQYFSNEIELEGKKVVMAEVERRTERAMVQTIGEIKLFETEAKSCRNHCTSMQSIIRGYSDEAKGFK